MFGSRESERKAKKIRESGKKEKNGSLEPGALNFFHWQKSPFQSLGWVDLYPTSLQITKKNYKSNTITRRIWEEIQKGEQKGQIGNRNSGQDE